jgi:hypothetical protein
MFDRNSFTATEWTKMEAAGAIFLPGANGQRYGQNWVSAGWSRYWTASLEGEEHIYSINIGACGFYLRADETGYWGKKHMGCSVRLVQDIVEEVTPVGAMTWRADDEDIKDLGTIAENTTVRGLTFVATADKAITVDASTKSYDTITFTHRIKLNGTMAENARHLKFNVTGDATIEIYAMASSASVTRQLNIAAGAYNANLRQFDVTGDAVNYVKYDYTGDPTTIFVGSASSGINILGIVLTPKNIPTAIDNTLFPEGKDWGKASKFLINGQVYILRDGKYYTILGVPANPLTR